MGAGKACIKYLLFSFNVVFWLAGLAAVGCGIWMIFDPGRFNEFLGDYTFTIPASILIATGLFVMFVGFCGCWGAIRENKCMLGTYFTMLLLVFCAEVAAGVLGFLYRDKSTYVTFSRKKELRKTLTSKIRFIFVNIVLEAFVTSFSRKKIKEQITIESQNVIKNKYGIGDRDVDHSVDLLQEKLKCCGAQGPSDYYTSPFSKWYTNVNDGKSCLTPPTSNCNKKVPESCCVDQSKCVGSTDMTSIHNKGCIDELIDYAKENMLILGGIGIGLACVQLLGMCFACCLFFAIEEY